MEERITLKKQQKKYQVFYKSEKWKQDPGTKTVSNTNKNQRTVQQVEQVVESAM